MRPADYPDGNPNERDDTGEKTPTCDNCGDPGTPGSPFPGFDNLCPACEDAFIAANWSPGTDRARLEEAAYEFERGHPPHGNTSR